MSRTMNAGDSNEWFETLFAHTRVLAIFRGLGPERTVALARVAWDAGVRVVEVPIQTADDVDALRSLSAAAPADAVVGAGTVVRAEQVAIARDAGAVFTVSPGFDDAVVRASLAEGLPTLPGVATATEIQGAVRRGLVWLKAFPAAQLGPDWIRAMHGPYPDIRFVATGGITVQSGPAFLAAGVRAVALGSALGDPEQVDAIGRLTSM